LIELRSPAAGADAPSQRRVAGTKFGHVMADGATTPAVTVDLTRREAEVLTLLTRRRTDKEIAAALGISPRTAMSHVAAIRAKLGVRNRREAAAVARLDPT
jgi:DNA-binding CsgD family transcriptional regulator